MNNISQIIQNQFPGKAVLNKSEVAQILGVSQTTINRAISANELDKLPRFKRFGKGQKARYIFTISAIAEFLEA